MREGGGYFLEGGGLGIPDFSLSQVSTPPPRNRIHARMGGTANPGSAVTSPLVINRPRVSATIQISAILPHLRRKKPALRQAASAPVPASLPVHDIRPKQGRRLGRTAVNKYVFLPMSPRLHVHMLNSATA